MKITTIIYKLILLTYRALPYKKGFCLVIRKLGIPVEKLYRKFRFKGVFKVKEKDIEFKLYNFKTKVENEIFWKGFINTWEKSSLTLWEILCKQSRIIVDVGANTGIYSLMAASLNSDSKIYSFEPSKKTYQKLIKNLEINHFSNIKSENFAVSNKNGTSLFYDFFLDHQYSASLNREMAESFGFENDTYDIKTVTLDSYFNGVKVDLLKIDTEKHEKEVIQGMKNIIINSNPNIIIEVLTDEIGEEIQGYFDRSIYDFYEIDEENGWIKTDQIKKSINFNYLICRKEISNILDKINS